MRWSLPKITSLIFISLGLIPLLFTVCFHFHRQVIRHRMKEKMENHELQTLRLQEKEVIWMDKHEIWVNDQMFDIHTKELENGVYTFTGMYDAEETSLVKKHEDATNTRNNENQVLTQLFKCLKGLYCEPVKDPGTASGIPHQLPLTVPYIFSQHFPSIPTPPPQG